MGNRIITVVSHWCHDVIDHGHLDYLFINQILSYYLKENTKVPHCQPIFGNDFGNTGSFVGGMHRSSVDSPHKMPALQSSFASYDVLAIYVGSDIEFKGNGTCIWQVCRRRYWGRWWSTLEQQLTPEVPWNLPMFSRPYFMKSSVCPTLATNHDIQRMLVESSAILLNILRETWTVTTFINA